MMKRIISATILLPEKIQIYPNPASDEVTVRIAADFSATMRLSLYDMQGRLVLEKTFSERSIKLDVKPLRTGKYQIVLNGKTTSTEKLIVFK
jgi:hypothetical protein